jgi:hypothetical protein
MTLFSGAAARSEVVIEDVRQTDVTPFGFSIVWQTSEAATPSIEVFSDAAGTKGITGRLEVTPFPLWAGDPEIVDEYQQEEGKEAIRGQSRQLGLMKVGVHGCEPETTYYYRIQAKGAGGETATWPATGLASITTTLENAFVSDSKQLLITLVDSGESLDASGWEVTATAAETLFPISATVGDGAGVNQAFINLGRLFGTNARNWTPSGTKTVTLKIKGGASGPTEHSLSLDFSNEFFVATVYPVTVDVGVVIDSDGDGIPDPLENAGCTDPLDTDSDDDGIPDGVEDKDHDGKVDPVETDPCIADSDDDGISDGVEDANHDGVVNPGETDPRNADTDGDGYDDGEERAGGSDPLNRYSYPATITAHLREGFNLIAIPADVASLPDLKDWLSVFGDDTEIEALMAYDKTAGTFVTLIPGSASNESFILQGGEGLIVYASEDKDVQFTTALCPTFDLVRGINLVGVACAVGGDSAYDVLNALGSEHVTSVQRYSQEKGAFETAGFLENGQKAGIDFPIVPGEGYFLFMKQGVLDFRF